MRGLIETQVVDQKRTAGTGMDNLHAAQKEKWCCPVRQWDVQVVPPRTLSDKELCTPAPSFLRLSQE